MFGFYTEFFFTAYLQKKKMLYWSSLTGAVKGNYNLKMSIFSFNWRNTEKYSKEYKKDPACCCFGWRDLSFELVWKLANCWEKRSYSVSQSRENKLKDIAKRGEQPGASGEQGCSGGLGRGFSPLCLERGAMLFGTSSLHRRKHDLEGRCKVLSSVWSRQNEGIQMFTISF